MIVEHAEELDTPEFGRAVRGADLLKTRLVEMSAVAEDFTLNRVWIEGDRDAIRADVKITGAKSLREFVNFASTYPIDIRHFNRATGTIELEARPEKWLQLALERRP